MVKRERERTTEDSRSHKSREKEEGDYGRRKEGGRNAREDERERERGCNQWSFEQDREDRKRTLVPLLSVLEENHRDRKREYRVTVSYLLTSVTLLQDRQTPVSLLSLSPLSSPLRSPLSASPFPSARTFHCYLIGEI